MCVVAFNVDRPTEDLSLSLFFFFSENPKEKGERERERASEGRKCGSLSRLSVPLFHSRTDVKYPSFFFSVLLLAVILTIRMCFFFVRRFCVLLRIESQRNGGREGERKRRAKLRRKRINTSEKSKKTKPARLARQHRRANRREIENKMRRKRMGGMK